ncbi:MAG: hypothetical protein IJY48_06430, partial [Mailhella sp.]|nr:hypothetical protein [Mailhella sp.]
GLRNFGMERLSQSTPLAKFVPEGKQMSKFKCEFEFELIEAFCQWKNHTTKEFLEVSREGSNAKKMRL